MTSPLHIQTNMKSPLRVTEDTHKILDLLMSSLSEDDAVHIIRGDNLFAAILLRSVDHVEKISLLWKILGVESPDHLYACPSKVDSTYSDEIISVAVIL